MSLFRKSIQLLANQNQCFYVLSKNLHVSSTPNNQHNRQVEEVRIPVPWGHLAAKWWGPQDKRPILCLHGWQVIINL